MKPYKTVDNQWIELTEEPYAGIIYRYGRVELIEEDDLLRVKFEYELENGERMDHDFVQYIGPILSDLISEGVMNNSITYTGGTDEN